MIAHIFGVVAEKFGGAVIVDVAGVGYEINVAAGDYDAVILDQTVKFYTYHHIREQSQELFGFSSLAGKKLFEMLITVQGVGPKAALAILSLDAAENVQKRGFAGAGRPDNREKFPLLHGEGDIVHGVHGVFAAAVDLGQVFDPHQFHKLSSR